MSQTGKKGSTRLITHTHTHTVPAHISVEHTSPLALTATRVPSSVTGADAVDVHIHKNTLGLTSLLRLHYKHAHIHASITSLVGQE